MKLEQRDERALALLGTRARSISELAAELDVPPEELGERFAELANRSLVREVEEGKYERTESGRRVLMTSQPGISDERIDTDPRIERTINEFDLGPDEADAVRRAFAFLRYWGRAIEEEIIDAIYSEEPAGYETADRWWDELVKEPLAALPGVQQTTVAEEGACWLYTGTDTPESDDPFADGRRVLSRTHPVYGDAKHTLESFDLTDGERVAARAAFRHLYRRGEATEQDIQRTVFPEHAAGYATPQEWWDSLIEVVFESLPGVEKTGQDTWHYRGSNA